MGSEMCIRDSLPGAFLSSLSSLSRDTLPLEPLDLAASSLAEYLVSQGTQFFRLGRGRLGHQRSCPWWSQECALAVAARRRAFRLWRRCPSIDHQVDFRRQDARCRQIVISAKRASWRAHYASIGHSTPSGATWRFLRWMAGVSEPPSYPLTSNGVAVLDDAGRADIFLSHFRGVFGSPPVIGSECTHCCLLYTSPSPRDS